MIIDTSAAMAVLFLEEVRERIIAALLNADRVLVGSPTRYEMDVVATGRRGVHGQRHLHRLMQEFQIEEVPFGPLHREQAAIAYSRFGRRNHAARLNLGDCMSYAVAKVAGEPLLCVGDDFAKTDLELVPLG